jgi:hypothetical protein
MMLPPHVFQIALRRAMCMAHDDAEPGDPLPTTSFIFASKAIFRDCAASGLIRMCVDEAKDWPRLAKLQQLAYDSYVGCICYTFSEKLEISAQEKLEISAHMPVYLQYGIQHIVLRGMPTSIWNEERFFMPSSLEILDVQCVADGPFGPLNIWFNNMSHAEDFRTLKMSCSDPVGVTMNLDGCFSLEYIWFDFPELRIVNMPWQGFPESLRRFHIRGNRDAVVWGTTDIWNRLPDALEILGITCMPVYIDHWPSHLKGVSLKNCIWELSGHVSPALPASVCSLYMEDMLWTFDWASLPVTLTTLTLMDCDVNEWPATCPASLMHISIIGCSAPKGIWPAGAVVED